MEEKSTAQGRPLCLVCPAGQAGPTRINAATPHHSAIFISDLDLCALSLRPLLLFFPLLLLQPSTVSQGGSVHPYVRRLQQLSCKPQKTSLFAGNGFCGDKPLMFPLVDKFRSKMSSGGLSNEDDAPFCYKGRSSFIDSSC